MENKSENITWSNSSVGREDREKLIDQKGCVVWLTGLSGSGKSTFIHSIICSLLLRFSSKDFKFILIDPKRIELIFYNELSYFSQPVILDPKVALYKLESLSRKTELRLKTKDICPYIFLIIDTFSDLFFENPNEFEKRLSYIASRSKETNIFVLTPDSRVGSEIYTNKILNSFQVKIAFTTADIGGSNCLIGVPDAVNLLNKGDMLVFLSDEGKLLHLRGVNISEETIIDIVSNNIKSGVQGRT